MNKLNAEQIIKALECCTRGRKSKYDRPCLDCHYNECNLVGGTSERQTTGTCQGWLMKDALALIKELTEENKVRKGLNTMLNNELRRLGEENERLKSVEFTCGFVKPHKVLECPIFDEIEKVKSDTVREMHSEIKERCIKGGIYPVFVENVIDQIVKEMLEGKNEK